MVGGQMLDIEAETRTASGLPEITLIQSLKTGALFRYACEAGAILGGADPAPLIRYAEKIGLAFQIADDILDVEFDARGHGQGHAEGQGRWARPPSSTSSCPVSTGEEGPRCEAAGR